ncbi:SigB/SigF/SigG family RNA polymerase sigma factor [Nocardia sp. CA-128927]|uniref:SigB/SigF/SigG family RNA polymerase sigma factor n=1 Tax=Nocardia sp. CA-128927 TaxID=3239975 RepID=UPI003D97EDE8
MAMAMAMAAAPARSIARAELGSGHQVCTSLCRLFVPRRVGTANRWLGEARGNRSPSMNSAVQTHPATTANRANGYDNLEPWFERLAALPADDPHRQQLRDEIVCRALPLATHIARRFARRGEPLDDLQQIARVGLLLAVERFDYTRGPTFLSFAIPTIMGEVRRHFRDRTWALRVSRTLKEIHARLGPATEMLAQRLGRLPTARELAVELDVELTDVTQAMSAADCYKTRPLESTLREDDSDSGYIVSTAALGCEEQCYHLLEDAMAVRPLIEQLPEQERQILIWRYFGSMTQSEIGQRIGVSQMQVSRILDRILTSLREQALASLEPSPA